MKRKTIINDIEIKVDQEVFDELERKAVKFLIAMGYEVRKKKPMPSKSNGYNIGDCGLFD